MIDQEKAKQAVRLLLEAMGEDPDREGLVDTPERVARMYQEICGGYDQDASVHLAKTFAEGNGEMVLERDIPFYSLCEHHMLPFFGKCHIAYISNGKVVGLSKLARTVEVFARRLQVQERMTAEIAQALVDNLDTEDVMVAVEAEHMCMSMRGIKKQGATTFTTSKHGRFAEDVNLANQFLMMIR